MHDTLHAIQEVQGRGTKLRTALCYVALRIAWMRAALSAEQVRWLSKRTREMRPALNTPLPWETAEWFSEKRMKIKVVVYWALINCKVLLSIHYFIWLLLQHQGEVSLWPFDQWGGLRLREIKNLLQFLWEQWVGQRLSFQEKNSIM